MNEVLEDVQRWKELGILSVMVVEASEDFEPTQLRVLDYRFHYGKKLTKPVYLMITRGFYHQSCIELKLWLLALFQKYKQRVKLKYIVSSLLVDISET